MARVKGRGKAVTSALAILLMLVMSAGLLQAQSSMGVHTMSRPASVLVGDVERNTTHESTLWWVKSRGYSYTDECHYEWHLEMDEARIHVMYTDDGDSEIRENEEYMALVNVSIHDGDMEYDVDVEASYRVTVDGELDSERIIPMTVNDSRVQKYVEEHGLPVPNKPTYEPCIPAADIEVIDETNDTEPESNVSVGTPVPVINVTDGNTTLVKAPSPNTTNDSAGDSEVHGPSHPPTNESNAAESHNNVSASPGTGMGSERSVDDDDPVASDSDPAVVEQTPSVGAGASTGVISVAALGRRRKHSSNAWA